MAENLVRGRPYDPWETPIIPATPIDPLAPVRQPGFGIGAPTSTQLVRDVRPPPPAVVAPPPVAAPIATGSSLNTLYGIDSESFLTDDQRKLARQIQGKFDASNNRRDRELQRWNAPMLASNVEDEAIARAIAAAQGLNYRPPPVPVPIDPNANNRRIAQSRLPNPTGNGAPRRPGDTTTPPPPPGPTGAQTGAEWQRIMSGLFSIAPLLFGKDAYKNFLNDGLITTVKKQIFGDAGNNMSNAQFEAVIKQYGDPYGSGSGWGQDVLQTSSPDFNNIGVDQSTLDWSGGEVTAPTFDWNYTNDWGNSWDSGDWGLSNDLSSWFG